MTFHEEIRAALKKVVDAKKARADDALSFRKQINNAVKNEIQPAFDETEKAWENSTKIDIKSVDNLPQQEVVEYVASLVLVETGVGQTVLNYKFNTQTKTVTKEFKRLAESPVAHPLKFQEITKDSVNRDVLALIGYLAK